MTGPYRDAPDALLLCPRCGDVFEDVFEGVSACVHCGGHWLAQPVIDRAFDDPFWPSGPSMWWHRDLQCPQCALAGEQKTMVAVEEGGVILDRCRGHGVWFDDGELARVLGQPDACAALYQRLEPLKRLPERPVPQAAELERRRRAAADHRARLADFARSNAADAGSEVSALEAKVLELRERLRQAEQDLEVARARARELK